ncbi:nitroreductase family protein [Methylomarinum sp. Ch1-1]|uniref:Nitroreductase family protein n=1 Tax=Methylomarinum roseum TaxID=3067653 RepID=A0AAU7NS11_9GAMM|nr:nitroreductase family protein [Methylomarinum sp. Ch1-1]MDP4520238.1 nitroreductase [Methylomarinum sp. Ch1-1]
MLTVSDYHQRTKHSFQRYARGPETLDWDDQPDPFRRFDGCTSIDLPKPGRELAVSWSALHDRAGVTPALLNMKNLGLLLELAFGLSAWKQYGPARWALRCNPSSGNLHPSEAYLINGVSGILKPGIYHYVSHDHKLERRCAFGNNEFPHTLLLGLSSIHWREAWKYGERAFRYCQLDAGHALAALSYAASVLGWRIELLGQYTDSEIAALLGIDRTEEFIDKERESPDWLCRICYSDAEIDSEREKDRLMSTISQSVWQGRAQSLGSYHMYHWSVLDEIAQSTRKTTGEVRHWCGQAIDKEASACSISATRLIRQRRSAQHFNARADEMGQVAFRRILECLRASGQAPFDAWNWRPAVHLCLFIHKVEDLPPGLYCWPRSTKGIDLLRTSFSSNFIWQETNGIPGLFLLYQGDVRQAAKTLSCHQAIASNSAFSLAMLAEFNQTVAEPWHYRRLFWECGLLGQILYLEAEAAGMRGTGIGCFFDDAVHGVLGIQDDSLQSLYHFTVGEPLEDTRIQTLPAYAHLNDR